MTAEIISGFVLALAVGAFVGLALTISALKRDLEELSHLCTTLRDKAEADRAWIGRVETMLKTRTPESLKVEVDSLRGALGALRASNRKEFGSLWARVGGRSERASGAFIDGETGEILDTDDEVEAMIALQRATPIKGQ